ncbi:Alpha/Beta hydrolase protein [Vararia minispora EC-137]|uniref:Alpha/Beta hydrolase protein n=1 Tax=Vararia minispora EC-137 TaxID=1314806 RepID=A0ACB8QZE9_9AGAM|nr:Alpha/Beta hydrolase protein [Vararia minispora EC-137]
MKFGLASSSIPLVFAAASAIKSDPSPIVDLGYAVFLGNTTTPTGILGGSVIFFGGIPYAQPPVGDLRWRAPQPLNETTPAIPVNVTDARNFAEPCIQQPAAAGVGSEDCLRLNVWMPANATRSSKLPVAFYIHGGGFFAGTPQAYPLYDWVAQNPGIVGVSVSYRLNALGYLTGPGIAAGGDYNVGLLDQRAALEWVQRHIPEFGGDPDEVTIIGESAGGASVIMQITAFGGSQPAPFKRAVPQSIGYGPSLRAVSFGANAQFKNFTVSVGCSAGLDPTAAMVCLRNASLDQVILGINSQPQGAFSPVFGDRFMPELPSDLFRAGRFSPVEYMAGHCTNDGRTFVGGSPRDFVTDTDIVSRVFSRWPGVTNATIERVFDFYPPANVLGSPFPREYDLGSVIAGDVVFTCMDKFIADHMVAKGVKKVFTFRWNTPNPVLLASAPYRGTMHTSDIYFLFDGETLSYTAPNAGFTFEPFNASEARLSSEAIAFWTSFVTSQDPSVERLVGTPSWPTYTSQSRSRMVFSLGNALASASVVEQIDEFETSRCAFWFQKKVTEQTTV